MAYVTRKTLKAKARAWMDDATGYTYPRPGWALSPDRAALLVIDMQRYFAHPEGRSYLPATAAILENINRLATAFRHRRRPVIFTRHGHDGMDDLGALGTFWGDHIRKGEPDWEIAPGLDVHASDLIVDKNRYDSFHGTGLESILREKNAEQVVITGVMTHLCCETTARSAFVRDLEVYFAADATATSRLELHTGTLRSLANGFGILFLADDAIKIINEK